MSTHDTTTTEARHMLATDLAPACGDYPNTGGMRLTPVLADVTCTACHKALLAAVPDALQRVLDYLAKYAAMSNMDPEVVHEIWRGGQQAQLLTADLNTLATAAQAAQAVTS